MLYIERIKIMRYIGLLVERPELLAEYRKMAKDKKKALWVIDQFAKLKNVEGFEVDLLRLENTVAHSLGYNIVKG